jgi:hypothetical protein
MRGRQITFVECVLLLGGTGILWMIVRASQKARHLDVAPLIDALLDLIEAEDGGERGRSNPPTPLLVLKPDRRSVPRPRPPVSFEEKAVGLIPNEARVGRSRRVRLGER